MSAAVMAMSQSEPAKPVLARSESEISATGEMLGLSGSDVPVMCPSFTGGREPECCGSFLNGVVW